LLKLAENRGDAFVSNDFDTESLHETCPVDFCGLSPPNKAPLPQIEIWNTISLWNIYPIWMSSSPCTNVKPPSHKR